MLQLNNISKSYGSRPVLRKLSLTARSGEVIGILGQSGAGKSTLLNGVAGLIRFDSGDVFLHGERITQLSANSRLHKRVGLYSEVFAVGKGKFFGRSRTVREELQSHLRKIRAFPSLGRRLSDQEAFARSNDLIKRFRLERVTASPVKILAGGELRRFELAKCVAHEPRLILLDEPFSGMDPVGCKTIQQLISELQQADVTILLTDQHYEHVLEVANRIDILWNHEIVTSDSPSSILDNEVAQKVFFDNDGNHYAPQRSVNSEDTVLEVRGLVKDYPNCRAVDGLDIVLRKNEIVGLLGPNGAGKTSCFRSITGFTQMTEGELIINGMQTKGLKPWHLVSVDIGYLEQNYSIFPRLTVDEHIHLARSVSQNSLLTPSDIKYLFGLETKSSQRADTLSGGERRRLEIAMLAIRSPSILLLDEPFTGIDPVTIHSIQDIIFALQDNGIAILLCDHRERETLTITNRSYVIHKGQLLVEGDAQTVLSNQAAQDNYFGRRFDADSIMYGTPYRPKKDSTE